MADDSYVLLDTKAIDTFIAERSSLLSEYESIEKEYKRIVTDLCDVWKGKGADAFKKDAERISKNISGLGDILETVCDKAQDIRDVFSECDSDLGESNRKIL